MIFFSFFKHLSCLYLCTMPRFSCSAPSVCVKRECFGQAVESLILFPQLHYNTEYVNSVLSVSLEGGTMLRFKYIGRTSPMTYEGHTGTSICSQPIPWHNDDPAASTFCWGRISFLANGHFNMPISSSWQPWFAFHAPSAGVTEQEFGIDFSSFLTWWIDFSTSWCSSRYYHKFAAHDPMGALEEDYGGFLSSKPAPTCVIELESFTPSDWLNTRVLNNVIDPAPGKII